MRSNVSTFIGCDSGYERAETVLLGAPFDGTACYRPGARFGPNAIRQESFGLESYSIYQDKDLCDIPVLDAGDLEFPFGNPGKVLDQIEGVTEKILADGKRPFLLGGEHLVTLGAVRAAARRYPELCLLHLDAHADLREDYMGERLSHATVIRRAWELIGDDRIFQFGIRSCCGEEAGFVREGHLSQQKYTCDGFAEVLEGLVGKPLYVTVDLDVLDPAVFPGTGTPEAGGVSFRELLDCILALRGHNVRGLDVVELAPVYDPSGVSTATACKAVRELLLAVAQG